MIIRFSKIFFSVMLCMVVLSCSSVKRSVEFDCKYNELKENLGGDVNTKGDEIAPVLFRNEIYYVIKTKEKNSTEFLYKVSAQKDSTAVKYLGLEDDGFKFSGLMLLSTPGFYFDKDSNIVAVFSAIDKKDKRKDRNFYKSVKKDNSWGKPELVKSLNSKSYEGQITFSKDSKVGILSSDRPKGKGGVDLYLTKYNEDGTWSQPVNLGDLINTESDENFPLIMENWDLLYSTKHNSSRNDYNIARSEYKQGVFQPGKLFASPINSDYEDAGAVILGDKIFLSSNRVGGCGGFDLYSYDLCAPAVISGKILSKDGAVPRGSLVLSNTKSHTEETHEINETGNFNFEVKSGENYHLTFHDECDTSLSAEQLIDIPCSEENIQKYVLNFILPESKEFNFEKYNVPFFLSGYYLPITRVNLDDVKLRFHYNLIGNSDSTKYIEFPGEAYYDYSPTVENALNEAVNYIVEKLKLINARCQNKYTHIQVSISGFADERKFGDAAIYDGPTIVDVELNVNVRMGAKMTNDLISTLRAYHTLKELQKRIKAQAPDIDSTQLVFEIIGQGIDPDHKQMELKRRVDLTIKPVE